MNTLQKTHIVKCITEIYIFVGCFVRKSYAKWNKARHKITHRFLDSRSSKLVFFQHKRLSDTRYYKSTKVTIENPTSQNVHKEADIISMR